MAQMTEVLLPDIGDFKDVEVIEILVRPGDTVAVEDPLITLESDKASMDIPAPSAGTVGEIRVAVGDKINEGDLILLLAAAGEPGGEAPTPVDEAPAAEAAEMVDDAPGVVEPTMPQPDLVVAAGEARDVLLPDIGDFHDVEVIEILVGVGDEVAEEQSLLTLESDKATMEIPAPFAGVVQSIGAAIGAAVVVAAGRRCSFLANDASPNGSRMSAISIAGPALAPAAMRARGAEGVGCCMGGLMSTRPLDVPSTMSSSPVHVMAGRARSTSKARNMASLSSTSMEVWLDNTWKALLSATMRALSLLLAERSSSVMVVVA